MSSPLLALVPFAFMLAAAPSDGQSLDTFGRLEKLAGDRQIVVGPFFTPKSPYAVRVLDTSGTPMVDMLVYMSPSSTPLPCPWLRDEFEYFGFHADTRWLQCAPSGSGVHLSRSDGSGVASKNPNDFSSPTSSFLMGASIDLPPDIVRLEHDRRQFFTIVRAENVPPGNPSVVVEYFHETFRHYFNTVLQAEIDGLDRGVFPGWTRSVGGFIAWATAADAPSGAVPVCRFFSSKFTSHFYTADAIECDEVVERFGDEWQLETREAYYIYRPDKSTGACIEGTMPVYRVYAGATRTPNHRYVTDRGLRDTMVSQGWIAEGYGPDAVIMCTPR